MSCKKAVLFERGLALAVAMRSFRVGAIALPPPPLLPGLPPPSPATAGAAGLVLVLPIVPEETVHCQKQAVLPR